ncbi:MAG: hypothetical protein WBP69_18435 [Terriglobales bacterium]
MDVTVLATGHPFYEINSQLGALLVDAGICSKIEKPALPKPKPLPEWGICKTETTGIFYIRHCVGASTEIFDGPVERAKFAMPSCPDEIIGELRTLRRFRQSTVPHEMYLE